MKAKISKAKKTIAIAIAGSLALIWSGAVAAAGVERSVEGRTSVPASESTPGLAGLSDDAVATGSTLGIGGSGTVGYDSTRGGENVDYWRLGEEPSGGASASSDRHSGVIVHPEPNR